MIKYGWRRIIFILAVLAYLGFLAFINIMMLLPGNWISAMGHFSFIGAGESHDLIHEIIFALIIGTAAIGLLSQLWKPKENFTGQLVALFAWATMFLIALITNNWVPQPLLIIFGGLTLIATILHPAGLGLFNWVRTAKVNKTLLTLIIIAALPLIVLAFSNISLQLASTGGAGFFEHNPPAIHGGNNQQSLQDQLVANTESKPADDESEYDQKHINLGHYRNIAVLSFIIILTGLLATFKLGGRRFVAWITGLLPITLGVASVILPDAESSLGLFWSFAAIVWGVAFITTSEKIYKKD